MIITDIQTVTVFLVPNPLRRRVPLRRFSRRRTSGAITTTRAGAGAREEDITDTDTITTTQLRGRTRWRVYL